MKICSNRTHKRNFMSNRSHPANFPRLEPILLGWNKHMSIHTQQVLKTTLSAPRLLEPWSGSSKKASWPFSFGLKSRLPIPSFNACRPQALTSWHDLILGMFRLCVCSWCCSLIMFALRGLRQSQCGELSGLRVSRSFRSVSCGVACPA